MTAAAAALLESPDFVCIGAQKAGTNWLDANLRRHPRIWMPWIKELQDFNHVHVPAHRAWTGRRSRLHGERAAERLRRRSGEVGPGPQVVVPIGSIPSDLVSDERYGRIFAHSRADQSCREVTPEYILLRPQGIAHVLRLNSYMKSVFLMGDPVERCRSHLPMPGRGREEFGFLRWVSNLYVLVLGYFTEIRRAWIAVLSTLNLYLLRLARSVSNPVHVLRDMSQCPGVPVQEKIIDLSPTCIFFGEDFLMPEEFRGLLTKMLAYVRSEIKTLLPRRASAVSRGTSV